MKYAINGKIRRWQYYITMLAVVTLLIAIFSDEEIY